jgi:hypothetical protein
MQIFFNAHITIPAFTSIVYVKLSFGGVIKNVSSYLQHDCKKFISIFLLGKFTIA